MLTSENVNVIKFWLHLGKAEQKRKLKELKADPRTRWRVSKNTWKFFDMYDDFRRVSEEAVEQTNTGYAPWTIVEATDWRYRNLTVVSTLLQRIHDAQNEADQRAKRRERPRPHLAEPKDVNIIRQLDLKKKIAKETYDKKLAKLQGDLGKLSRKLQQSDKSLVLVFEGADAAGKGGAIRRITSAVDARLYKVNAVAAPTDEEAARPYLWRFWRQVPHRGHIAIFDRSWYGRVLVERVEGFSPPSDWKRAYSEINEFEAELTEFGAIVLKFWLATSAQEQLRRFKDRQTTPYKQYKITEEDWRNRKKWNAYEAAACDMIERTSTDQAPWTLVAANDKRWARIPVLDTVVGRLKKYFKLDKD